MTRPLDKRGAACQSVAMREKELRLALVCYGGISLAVYMHGISLEIWRLLRASRAYHSGEAAGGSSEAVYHALLDKIASSQKLKLSVFSDIIAGASAGGINGIFLAQAISTGQSLEPLTRLWLDAADVEQLLDPDARPIGRFTKFWAQPIAWVATRRPGGTVERTVGVEARAEVRQKLSHFVRARWFEPPFGGSVFSNLLLDAFVAMEASGRGPPLIPDDQPLDLFVTVTDFRGHPERLRLNSPREIVETEHRLTVGFRSWHEAEIELGDMPGLVYAARATASFPGAFPPFKVAELDGVLKARNLPWDDRAPFLARVLPRAPDQAEKLILIDGSVLANAPFRPAIEALRERPAQREVDRRFVYIDPKPGIRAVSLKRSGEADLPGFFATILGAMSDIPREQPIRDSLDSIEGRSARIRRMQRIVEAVRPEVEQSIQALFGRTFFIDRPTPKRIAGWRDKAQVRAAQEAGHAFAAYGHIKLSGTVEEIVGIAARLDPTLAGPALDAFRLAVWNEVRKGGVDSISGPRQRGASPAAIGFFRDHDIRFRIRRLRFLARTLVEQAERGELDEAAIDPIRDLAYKLLAPYLDRESVMWFEGMTIADPAAFLSSVAERRALIELDRQTDFALAATLAAAPKAERRAALLAYVGFPYFDISTLPLLQGEGLDEFDPIKVDRIAPDDARSIRAGGAQATLKGIEFNSFGAFFSRAYRENDYLWGRLHGAERLIDIVCSTLSTPIEEDCAAGFKRAAFEAILDEEERRLTAVPTLCNEIRQEIASGPLAKLSPHA